ncbi:uncharacterized protein DUF2283 [Scopulibacillus darangshiensis]|uniref:Uncharacterized protein DUF2283 n=1 Tax=Scopulibacillus darangshiensis TaxID=442528 RepID=A0A4V2SLA7_9BACL|nr:DUF2283 domain-containing protein [Scopulibacillus darangshiensis]TCP22696.1 uncharacterized protein DUF2283 [Scopulibacillus darangshiensis]
MTRVQIQKRQIKYDQSHDILHVYFHPEILSEDDERFPGIVIRKSLNDEQVTGLTIIDFSQYDQETLNKLLPDYKFPDILH